MPIHTCAKCNRKAKVGYKFCLACEKAERRAMAADGYLTNTTALDLTVGPKAPSERNVTYNGSGSHVTRNTRDLPPARQIHGGIMKPHSKKVK